MRGQKVLKNISLIALSAMLVFNSMSLTAFAEGESVVLQNQTGSGDTIMYQGKAITLSEHALYVNAKLNAESEFEFKSLQSAVAAAKAGTKEEPTVIYLEPDVYWTDDYTVTQDRQSDDLIGLKIPQSYITLAGMTGNPEDVIIASDRGQNAGADGNFNTIGVADGFHAKDLTIGNYCNVDLNYALDPSKSHPKRQESITQAQAVTKVPEIAVMDEWYFEHCNIISRLNLFSRDERPYRSLLKDCHLECTDDSLGTGYITIFENCTFDLYSNTPVGGASFYLQAYLGCTFTTHLSDNKTITLCKNTKPFVFIDNVFQGDMTGMEWKPSNLSDDLRQIVSNNKLNGKDLFVSPSKPELSVTPDAKQMEAFKYNGEYNIYNMLNGAGYDEWDPLGQKGTMPVAAWNIQFDYPGETKDVTPALEGNNSDSLEVTPVVLGGTDKTVSWSVYDSTLSIQTLSNGNVQVKGNNDTVANKTGCLIATAANGLQKVLHFTITPEIIEKPVFVKNPELSQPKDGKISVSYALPEVTDGSTDKSQINWYRSKSSDGSDKVLIAKTTYVKTDAVPFTSYTLRPSDIGSYILSEVIPQRSNSEAGNAYITTSSAVVKDSDVAVNEKSEYDMDLEHFAYIMAQNDTAGNNYEWTTQLENGNWYGGYYLPAEYRAGGIWQDKAYAPAAGEAPYTFAKGDSGALGTYGLQTTTQGARLVYVDDTPRKDMKMSIKLSPHKTSAQGFGAAKAYLDVFFKYDAKTMTGYGLRIARVPEIPDPVLANYAAKSCTFTLMEFKNGIASPISDSVVSTAFLPGCSIEIQLNGNKLTADVTTTSAQDSGYPAEMTHEVHLSHTFVDEVNSFSGFGFQHTGTAGAGKSGNRTTIHSVKVEYPAPYTIALNAESVGKTSAKLGWTTNMPETVTYSVYQNGQFIGTTDNLEYTVENLNTSSDYNFYVIGKDLAGHVITSNTVDVTTSELSPIELRTTDINRTSIELGWTAPSDAVGTVSYEVYKNGESVGTTKELGLTVTGLTSSTKYSFVVKAIDSNGNRTASNTVEATTLAKHSTGTGAGTGSGSGSTGTGTETNTNTNTAKPNVTTTNGNTVISLPDSLVSNTNGTAAVSIDVDTLDSAFNQAKEQKSEVQIKVPDVTGISQYSISLPAAILSGAESKSDIDVISKVAEVKASTDMLSNVVKDRTGKIELNIKLADNKNIPEKVQTVIGNRPVIELSVASSGNILQYNNPSSPVLVSIPYAATAEELQNPEHIVVYYVDGKGNLIPVPNGRYDVKTGKVTFSTSHFSSFAIAYVNKSFEDITDYSWAKDAIEVMASKGVIKGTSDKTFNPAENITRADFAMMLVNALGLNAKADYGFKDVSSDDYYFEALGTAKALGIIKGQEDGKFNPNEEISRQDMMVIAARALRIANKLGVQTNQSAVSFKDKNDISDYAVNEIGALVSEGLIKGNDNIIEPLKNTTRAEAIVLIYRMYNK